MNNFDRNRIHKILVVNFGGIGDFLLSTPALRALRQAYPGAWISVAATPAVACAARDLPYIDKIFCFEVAHPWIRAWYNLRTLLALRSQRMDLAINMRTLVSAKSALKMRLLLALIRPKITAGRNTAGRGAFFDIAVDEALIGARPEMEYDIALSEALGALVCDRSFDCRVRAEDRQALSDLLARHGITGSDTLVGIHPGGRPSRRWPAHNFSSVIRQVSRERECVFLVTGAGNEHGLAEAVIKESGQPAINLTGKLTLGLLAALLERCALYISNDTGPMHMAAMLKTPLIAILGPGCFDRYNPAMISDRVRVFYKPAACGPCNRYHCSSLICLRAIGIDEVAIAALERLDKPR